MICKFWKEFYCGTQNDNSESESESDSDILDSSRNEIVNSKLSNEANEKLKMDDEEIVMLFRKKIGQSSSEDKLQMFENLKIYKND